MGVKNVTDGRTNKAFLGVGLPWCTYLPVAGGELPEYWAQLPPVCWSQGAPLSPPLPANVITGFRPACLWLLLLLLFQSGVITASTLPPGCDHRLASMYTISAQIWTPCHSTDAGWWLQEVKWLITPLVKLLIGACMTWLGSEYDLITKEVWSQIIAHNQGYQKELPVARIWWYDDDVMTWWSDIIAHKRLLKGLPVAMIGWR